MGRVSLRAVVFYAGELDQEKLPQMIELKYHAITDAVAELGTVAEIREMFIGFQKHLYAEGEVS